MTAAKTFSSARFQVSRRTVLWTAFSALLILMAVIAYHASYVLRNIEQQNTRIRADYISRDELLDQLRFNLYRSGIDVRDYLLEVNAERAERRRGELQSAYTQMKASLANYRALASGDEAAPFSHLEKAVDDYWSKLQPALHWDAAARRKNGDAFLREVLFPRHEQLVELADRIVGLNNNQLDSGARRVVSLFADFRRELTVTALLTVMVGIAVAAISAQRISYLERMSALQYAEVARAREELQQLSSRLIATQEEERRRLSRELHDEVGQTMSALLVELNNLDAKVSPGAHESVLLLRRLAETSVGVIRNMALLLRPSMLDDLGLVPALRWQAREMTRRTGIRVRVAAEDVPDDLPDEHRTCLYRVVQEALNNSGKHSHASTVRVSVRLEENHLRVVIQDDGSGFDPAKDKGMGLIGMEERVKALGGVLRVDSEPGGGTIVSALLPVPEHSPVTNL
jgi:signal transduction histidine kinase